MALFRCDIGKSNNAPPSKAAWYKRASVGLGNDSGSRNDNGAPIDDQDYVAVATPWQWPDAFEGVTVHDLRAAQAEVDKGRWRQNPQAKDWVGYPIARALKLDLAGETAKANKAKIRSLLSAWIGTGMFVVVEGEDENRKKRSFVEVGERADD
jgi:hypothetical protein